MMTSHISPVCLQYLDMTDEDHDTGTHPGNTEQHPVEGDVGWLLAEIVHRGGDEISLVRVSVTAHQGRQTDQTGGAPDPEDQQFQSPLPGSLVA